MPSQTFTASGTFTWPVVVNVVDADATGSGGGGNARSSPGGAGAGGGAFARQTGISKSGATDTVVVADGGLGGDFSGSGDGSDGSNSYFRDTGTVNAVGGKSAASGKQGGQATDCTGSLKYSGGDGADASGSPGGGGQPATSAGDGAGGSAGSGDGATPGGGSAGADSANANDGKRGEVVVSWTAGHFTNPNGPTNTKSGQTIAGGNITVEARFADGTLDTSYTGNVTVAIGTNAGGGTLSGTLTVAAVSGVATFSDLSIDKFGAGYTLTFSATDLTSATSGTFNITGDHLAFNVQPSNTRSGASITAAVKVELLDTTGGRDTNASDSITVAIGTNAGGGTLSGTLTVSLSSGLATFSDLSIDKFGAGYTLTASASGITGATSSTFNITGNHLSFVTQPSNTLAGAVISPDIQVELLDTTGARDTNAANSTALSINNNPGSGTLSGTNHVNMSSGLATFNTSLSINNPGVGYTLDANSTGMTTATSSPFNITAAATSLDPSSYQSEAPYRPRKTIYRPY